MGIRRPQRGRRRLFITLAITIGIAITSERNYN